VREVGCKAHLYSAGEAFVEHGDQPTGQVRNAGATAAAVFSVTQIAPAGIPRRAESERPPASTGTLRCAAENRLVKRDDDARFELLARNTPRQQSNPRIGRELP
jgi:hypothetical protein